MKQLFKRIAAIGAILFLAHNFLSFTDIFFEEENLYSPKNISLCLTIALLWSIIKFYLPVRSFKGFEKKINTILPFSMEKCEELLAHVLEDNHKLSYYDKARCILFMSNINKENGNLFDGEINILKLNYLPLKGKEKIDVYLNASLFYYGYKNDQALRLIKSVFPEDIEVLDNVKFATSDSKQTNLLNIVHIYYENNKKDEAIKLYTELLDKNMCNRNAELEEVLGLR
ncbi:hypothetical protein [Vallitalea okinawensis]|uniref:hypothetical protein n=1 Tax=Vallitalea okinawensis TaxID=2078660 RepID=UPI000CFB55E6|nr:hypothetical protein [Vallitalea okinawensis]